MKHQSCVFDHILCNKSGAYGRVEQNQAKKLKKKILTKSYDNEGIVLRDARDGRGSKGI